MRHIRLLFLIFLVFLLSACALASRATPTAQPIVSSPNDGEWKGVGTAAGKNFTITLNIQGDKLRTVFYGYPGSDGVNCTVVYAQVPVDKRPAVTDGKLIADLGEDLDLSASFSKGESVSGHLTVHRHDRLPRCTGDFEVDWTGTKQATAAQNASQTPASKPHPFATLLQILIFGLSNGSVLAINAIGVTIIYSTVRILNLAHGDVFALTTVLVTSIVNIIGVNLNWSPLQLIGILTLILVAAIILGALLSVGVEQLGFRPFRGSSRLAPLIATLGLSFILFQGALVWRTFQRSWIPGEHRSVPGLPEVPTDGIPSFLPEINLAAKLGIPHLVIRFSDVFVVAMSVLFVLAAAWFLQRTRTGHAIQALSQNKLLAQIVGVNVDATISRAFAVGGAFAGAAAFIFALYYARPFGVHGAQSGLMAFAAALLGGIGSPVGALISGLTIGVFSSLSDYYFSAQWTSVLLLGLLIILLVWRPTGLTSSDTHINESDSVRDSVILTAPGRGSGENRWLFILLLLLGVFPILAQVFGWGGQVILRIVEVFMLLTLGLNIALGVTGLLDFGFAASFGLGAYAGVLFSRYDVLVPLLVGAVLASLLGVIKGILAYRLRGDFLAVVTLALGLMVGQLAVNLPGITGGARGLSGFPAFHFLDLKLASPTSQFYLVFIFVVLAAFFSQRLIHSRTGRAWIASSEDETASQSLGINVNKVWLMSFVLSSALAGLAGALYAGTFTYVDSATMSFHISSMILTMVILGGAGNVPGAILGAAAIVLYDKVFVPHLADWVALIWPKGLMIGSAPDIRGASFFNFGIALYLTVLLRARKKNPKLLDRAVTKDSR